MWKELFTAQKCMSFNVHIGKFTIERQGFQSLQFCKIVTGGEIFHNFLGGIDNITAWTQCLVGENGFEWMRDPVGHHGHMKWLILGDIDRFIPPDNIFLQIIIFSHIIPSQ